MNDTKWYAVRCCCAPAKVMGFLRLTGNGNRFRVVDNQGQVRDLEISMVVHHSPSAKVTDEEYAVKSGDLPLSFWKKIPGFVPSADYEE